MIMTGGALPTLCSVPQCERAIRYKRAALCQQHYKRQRGGYPDWDRPLQYRSEFNGCPQIAATVHDRIRRLWGPARHHHCVACGKSARDWAYDGTDPDELYLPESWSDSNIWQKCSAYPEFYMPLCPSCHKRRDARAASAELHQYRLLKAQQKQ